MKYSQNEKLFFMERHESVKNQKLLYTTADIWAIIGAVNKEIACCTETNEQVSAQTVQAAVWNSTERASIMSMQRKETVIQFGEGGFLRGFVDYFFQKLKEK